MTLRMSSACYSGSLRNCPACTGTCSKRSWSLLVELSGSLQKHWLSGTQVRTFWQMDSSYLIILYITIVINFLPQTINVIKYEI